MNNQKKNRNKGFSLVELIVVIAIMAILVGVAVPVYTSYIEKSQKAKDIQLVDEVKHAVEIAAAAENWAGQLPAGTEQARIGSVVIKSNGTSYITPGENGVEMPVAAALTATFGDLSKLTLSYGGWKGTLNEGGAAVVASSNFGTQANATNLLKDVQNLTNDMQNIIGNQDWQDALLGTGFGDWLNEQGIATADTQSVANAATLYVAKGTAGDNLDTDKFMQAWMQTTIGNVASEASDLAKAGLSGMASLAAEYARAEAAVNYICAQTPGDVITAENADSVLIEEHKANAANYIGMHKLRYAFTKQRIVVSGTDSASIGTAYTSMQAVVNNVEQYLNNNLSAGTAYAAYISSANDANRRKDGQAYLALMKQVASSEDKVMEIGLDKPGLYNSAALTNYVSSYISVADLLSDPAMGDKDVIIAFSLTNKGAIIANAYPIEY